MNKAQMSEKIRRLLAAGAGDIIRDAMLGNVPSFDFAGKHYTLKRSSTPQTPQEFADDVRLEKCEQDAS